MFVYCYGLGVLPALQLVLSVYVTVFVNFHITSS